MELNQTKILKIQPMADFLRSQGRVVEFNGEVYLITFDNGKKAVFKAMPEDDIIDAYAEVAAYKTSTILGFPNIPPTVVYKVNDMVGSLQEYIEPDYDLLAGNNYYTALNSVSKDELDKLKLFYFIFGQWDTGPHNLLISNNHLFAIDNSGIKNRQHVKYGNLPFVRVIYSDDLDTDDFDKSFPFDSAKVIDQLENLYAEFGDKLPESFYKNFKSYNEPLKYIIYKNSLWKQHHAFHEEFVRSYVEQPSLEIINSIKKIDYDMLYDIFGDHINDFDTAAILERRDQVLDHYEIHKFDI